MFEDAPHGIQAAKTAGMNCVGVTNSQLKDELNSADMVIDNFLKLDIQELMSKF